MQYDNTIAWVLIAFEIVIFSMRTADAISSDTLAICAAIIIGAYIARGRTSNG